MEDSLKLRLKTRVMECLDMSKAMEDYQVSKIIDNCILEESNNTYIPLKEKMSLRKELFNTFRRFDVLTDLLEDEDITEIMVNGPDKIFVERAGKTYKTDKFFESSERLDTVIQQIVAECNRRINDTEPIVDARLRDGSRVNIIVPPVALDGATVTIRKFSKQKIDMERLVELGSIDKEVVKILDALVKSRYNIFISGGTGSGKTTFLNALSDLIPQEERIITIEDSAELQLQNKTNLVRLESRNANVEGKNNISIRDLIKNSLRMRPDRIIVGEVRDEAAIDMLAAMNTGHDGSLSTGHANSSVDMLSRLQTMVLMGMDIPLLAVKQQIASAVDIIIHLSRFRDGSRKVINISEVVGMKENEICVNTLFEYVETGKEQGRIKGNLRKVNDLVNVGKLQGGGMLEVYMEAMNGI